MSKNKIFIISIVSIIILLVAGGILYFQKNKKLNSADFALKQITVALKKHDTALFIKHVDTEKLAANILKQTIILPDAKSESISNKITRKFTSLVQPELTANIQEQMLEFVNSGGMFKQRLEISSVYHGEPLLKSVWTEFSGGNNNISFQPITKIDTIDDENAIGHLPFKRIDIQESGILELKLFREAGENWQVVSIIDLQDTLQNINKLFIAHISKKNLEIQSKITSSLKLVTASKSSGVSEWGVGQGILLQLGFHNTSSQDITGVHATVTFKDKNDDTLRKVTITDSDLLEKGQTTTKSWPMTINPLSASDALIYKDENSSIKISVSIDKISFADSSYLELIRLDL